MQNLSLRLFLYLWAIVLFFPPIVSGGDISERLFDPDVPVEVEADFITYDSVKDTYSAEGDVVAVHGGLTLKADLLTIDMASNITTAYGNVVVTDAEGDSLTGDSVRVEMEEDTAIIMRGRIFIKKDNLYISGEEIRKTGPKTYKAEKAVFTTCDTCEGESPAWSVRTSSSNATIGGYFKGWNAFFYIKNVPVLYSPFISAPVKRKRQTGFLTPQPGYSDIRGLKLDNAFFWAIAENRDATFYLDYEEKRGIGKGFEYRYIRNEESSGELFLYHFGERDIDRVREFREDDANLGRPLSADEDRWEIRVRHREYFGGGLNFKSDVRVVSDDEYFLDTETRRGERSLESLESTISVTKNWTRYNLVTEFRVFDNLLVEDDSTVFQKLPVVTFAGSNRPVFGTPFHVSFDTSFVNFFREEGTKGQRVDLLPRLSLPLRPFRLFEFTPSIAPRGTFYRVDSEEDGVEEHSRFLYEARADVITTFVRIYNFRWAGVERLISYAHVPFKSQDDLPEFDIIDRIDPANRVTYSLNMTVTGRFSESGRSQEFLYMDFAQSYDTRKKGEEEDRYFSDITGEIILRPLEWATLTGRGSYDVYDDQLENYDTTVRVNDNKGNMLGITYRFIRDSNEYLETDAGLRVWKALRLTYGNRFSFEDDKTIESFYGVEYTAQCWGAVLTFTDRIEEKLLFLTINLKGVGEVIEARMFGEEK
jgi:LPS-assembly protein